MTFTVSYHFKSTVFPTFGCDKCRFGFKGKEKDDEIDGVFCSKLDFGAKIYDSRLGRWMSPDPFSSKFASHSPYNFVENSPLWKKDLKGDSTIYYYQGVIVWISYDQLPNAVVYFSYIEEKTFYDKNEMFSNNKNNYG